MKKRRNRKSLSTKFYLLLRKIGMLCNKTEPYKPKLRISHSVSASGEEINSSDFMFAKNKLQGASKNSKDRLLCHYNYQTHTCRCGISLADLKNNKDCPIKN